MGLHAALIAACCGLGPYAAQTAEGFPPDSVFHFTKTAYSFSLEIAKARRVARKVKLYHKRVGQDEFLGVLPPG